MPSLLNVLAAGANPLEHVIDQPIFGWAFSNVTLMLILCGVVAMITLVAAASRIGTGTTRTLEDYRTQGIWANMVESVCVYLRNEVFRPVLGHDTDRFTPLLWTMFWFILICNLFGLVPLKDLTGGLLGLNHGHGFGGTATQSIWVTGALALISFVLINGVAIARDPAGYLKHMTGGAPWYIWPILIPVEILGVFVRPFALAMRLFANMTGGHVVVAVMLMFIAKMVGATWGQGGGMAALGIGGSLLPFAAMIGIYFLEIVVAVIQAFVFTFLTCLFLGQLIHHEHDTSHPHPEEHVDKTYLPGAEIHTH